MRLFIAPNFTDETRARLFVLRDELRAHSTRGNFSLPEKLHLTLASSANAMLGRSPPQRRQYPPWSLPRWRSPLTA